MSIWCSFQQIEIQIKNVLNIWAMIFVINGCASHKEIGFYETENLRIEQLTKRTFLHTSYLQTKSFGKVLCNVMIGKFKNSKAVSNLEK